jgi:hypothetical protein
LPVIPAGTNDTHFTDLSEWSQRSSWSAYDEEYKVLLIANEHVLDTQTAKRTGDGEIEVKFRSAVLAPSEYKTTDAPVPSRYR